MIDFEMPFMLKSVFIVGFTRFVSLAYRDNCVKTNEDTAILSATKMFGRDWFLVI